MRELSETGVKVWRNKLHGSVIINIYILIPIKKYLTRFHYSFSTVSTVYTPIHAVSRSLISDSKFDTHRLNIGVGLQLFRIILINSAQMWRTLYCNMRTQSCNSRRLDASSRIGLTYINQLNWGHLFYNCITDCVLVFFVVNSVQFESKCEIKLPCASLYQSYPILKTQIYTEWANV